MNSRRYVKEKFNRDWLIKKGFNWYGIAVGYYGARLKCSYSLCFVYNSLSDEITVEEKGILLNGGITKARCKDEFEIMFKVLVGMGVDDYNKQVKAFIKKYKNNS